MSNDPARPARTAHRPRRGRLAAVAGLGALTLVATGLATTQANASPDDPLVGSGRDQTGKVQVVHVEAPTPAARTKVSKLGLDMTEHGDATGVEVVLHGSKDAARLRGAGFDWKVKIPDLQARTEANQAKDRRYDKATAQSPLPSGRTAYRNLDDYNREMTRLAKRYPNLVKPLTLRNRSIEGRPVRGIEITTNARQVNDGKPAFLMLGAHHAREWPSAEHAMEFAYDLVENYRTDRRTRRIVQRSRTIVVPIVNVDGFVVSRTAAPLGDFSAFDYEMKRKNCSTSVQTPADRRGGTCADNPAGRLRGTDLNRNYPGFWGGPGASALWSSDTFRGDAPGSEPEVDNIRRLISQRQVTNLITNHTYGNLVLRPPSIRSTGFSPDEPAYRALGAGMTDANGYANWASFQLYDTSGSTEDWSYWNTGGLGFTFEIGPDEFHPPFQQGVVNEYLGLAPSAGAGFGGNREAYYVMAEATVNAGLHSTIVGSTRPNRKLTVSKSFITATSPVIQTDGSTGAPRYYRDTLASSYQTKGGQFSWAVNPSTRPLVVGRYGRDPQGPPQPAQTLVNPAGTPAEGAYETATFTVAGQPSYDNGTATVVINWPDAQVDWDVEVYDSRGRPVATAATLDDPEQAVLIDPAPGTYTIRLINYGGGATSDWTGRVDYASPTPGTYSGLKEAWNLTCSNRNGRVLSTREVIVDRGETVRVGDPCRRKGR
ncbi:peptidase M14 [Aeromicrobium sp. SMF47]|uniref:M14 family metallopeptidase n=1 Tax=Aeromicrobium yanjiei TaxID=2662028 RepID=UPI00129E7E10|nr:M14 family metallopeptidase [Aeromicrobium yanjiei]MRJ74962.1 peptidase M14 [Aeromicrobium yanjiei]